LGLDELHNKGYAWLIAPLRIRAVPGTQHLALIEPQSMLAGKKNQTNAWWSDHSTRPAGKTIHGLDGMRDR
jgi:hypothetical protein